MLYESDQFLLELSKLFQQQRVKTSGSLCLTMKRYDGRVKPKAKLTKKQRLEQKKNPTGASSTVPNTPTTSSEAIEYKCLVRANFGSKKISTVVSAKDINRFQLAYANVLKANMDTLKKKAKESKAASTAGRPAPSPTQTKTPMSPQAKQATASSPSVSSNTPKKTATPSKKK